MSHGSEQRPLVIAHRGASCDEPENTLPAFERAIALGADYIELDVHADATGTPVVCHDPPGPAPVPTLAAVVDAIQGRIGLMVELKQPYRYRRFGLVEHTLKLLDNDAIILCFEPKALRAVKDARPTMRVLQHVGYGVSISTAAAYAWGVGFDDQRVTPTALARAHSHDLITTVYTVNDERRMQALLQAGVDGIFSDRPDALRAVATQHAVKRPHQHPRDSLCVEQARQSSCAGHERSGVRPYFGSVSPTLPRGRSPRRRFIAGAGDLLGQRWPALSPLPSRHDSDQAGRAASPFERPAR